MAGGGGGEGGPIRSPFPDVHIDDRPMHCFLFDACRKYADRRAFIDLWSDKTYTYADIDLKCRSTAVGWHSAGLVKGECVSLLLPNCAEFVFAFVGAACRGALCSGLNPTFAQYELSHYLGTGVGGSGARFIVTTGDRLPVLDRTLAELRGHRMQTIFVVDARRDARLPSCKRSKVPVRPFAQLYADADKFDSLPPVAIRTRAEPVYMPYSSGTTGLPKGVLVSHYMMAGQFAQMSAGWYLQPQLGEHCVMFLPIFHMYGFIIFCQLLNSGCVVVSVPRFHPKSFFAAVQKYKSPMLYLVPPIMVMMAKHAMMDEFALSCVRSIMVGAAPVGEKITNGTKRRFPTIEHIVQGYGMSELGISHIETPVGGGVHMKVGSTGPMLPNYQAKVMDRATGEQLGANGVGELWCRAPGMMLGYHQNDSATAETIDKDNWLHTGDMCYYDSAGNFYMVDRVKELIKVSGFQVAPAELEDLLLSHPAVAEAAVVPIPDATREQVPRAYIVLKRPDVGGAGKQRMAEEILAFVEGKVAHYKQLRGGVKFVDEIPKLPSGKILRRILRAQAEKECSDQKAKM